MGEVQWIKIYIDMFDKRKIKKIRRLPAGNDLLLIWIMLLSMAGKCNAGGMIYITESVPFTEEDLADELDFDVNTIRLALGSFRELDMIATSEDGFINILGWEEYQNSDKLAEIRAKDRERKRLKKEQAKNALLSANSTEIPRNVHGNSTDVPCIEEEKEEDEEKENNSFTHSAREDEKSLDEKSLDEYIERRVEEMGVRDGQEELVREELRQRMKIRIMEGTLGQGVLRMSDEQFDDLCTRLSLDELHRYCGIVVECEKNGKPYTKKTHYQAILDMAYKDRRIRK